MTVQIQDHEKNDRRSRESAMSDKVDPMADISKELDTIMKEKYYDKIIKSRKKSTRKIKRQKKRNKGHLLSVVHGS